MDKEKKFQKVFVLVLFSLLVIISFLIVKKILMAIIAGVLLAYLLSPLYNKLTKIIKNKNIAAFVICLLFVLFLGASLWLGARALSEQAFEFYKNVKKYDITEKFSSLFGKLIIKDTELSGQVASTIKRSILELGANITKAATEFLSNILNFSLQLFVTFFTMFYFLRDGKEMYGKIRDLLPFNEYIKKKFEKRTQEITRGVIYGRVLIGIIQGLTAGIGFYLFGVKQPLLFTVLSMFFAILPLIGAWIVWIPVSINFIFAIGWKIGILHLLYHVIITNQIDNVVSPYIVGKTAKMNNAVALVGMVGGAISFGLVGFIIGPLILEYFFVFVEIYKENINKNTKNEKQIKKQK